MVSHPPHVGPLVVEAELEVSETIDRCLSRNSTDDGANLIFRRDVLVTGTLRNEVRTLQVERPELVRHDRLVRILQRLRNKRLISRRDGHDMRYIR